MFDPEVADTPLPSPAPRRTAYRMSWWVLGLAGLGALLLATCVKPLPVSPAAPADHAADPAPAAASPEPISLVDTVGKACAGLLLVYGVGWALIRLKRRGGWAGRSASMDAFATRPRLRVAETVSLGHQRATLHLVEVDGATLLLGSAMDQVCLLWTAASDHTAAFKPVRVAEADAEVSGLPRPATATRRVSRPERRESPDSRRESEWSRERSRLISALLHDNNRETGSTGLRVS